MAEDSIRKMNGAPDADIAVFTEALRLPREHRDRYLDEACKGDDEFRRRVEALLQAYEQSGDFLGKSAAERPAGAARALPAGEIPGDRIGHYRLLQQIGEGGCGVVYLAEQEAPLRRRVALKIIKPGMDTKSVIARFEAERQALALMDHPNIAQVFEAGTTDHGRPYFVMEFVKGVKLTDYCDQHSLSLDARLELLIQVCDAIQHAHQKGIIHRDIKPSNILVTTGRDRKPVPKVIDFGIAKAITGQQLTDKTIFTAYEMLIGTPAYMSPEQAALSITDVDTRTDIYSLGVLLYELLTGTTPFDTRELLKVGLDEVRRVIRTEQPMRPSTRLSTIMATDPAAFSRDHGGKAPKLIRQMRGELDWIVMKALEKDRTRRYATANGLAMDIQRYLAGEPVLACPPSRLYRFRKLVSRHKVEFAALGIVMATLVAGLSSTLWTLAGEKKARHDADLARQKALTEAARSKEVAAFLKNILTGVDPALARGRDTSVLREILDLTAEQMERELTNQPDVLAELNLMLAGAYGSLGISDKVERQLRSALDIYQRSPKGNEKMIADALLALARVHYAQSRLEETEKEIRQALAIDPSLEVEKTMRRVSLERLRGSLLLSRGRPAAAEPIFREALAMGERLVGEASYELRSELAVAVMVQGRLTDAESLLRKSLAVAQKKYGPEHSESATEMFRLALVLEKEDQFEEAETLARRCVAIRRKVLGPGHPYFDEALQFLAIVLGNEHEGKAAEEVYGELLELRRKRFGDQDARVLRIVASLTEILVEDHSESEFAQLARQFPEAWGTKAEDLGRRGRWPEALAAASRLVEGRPESHTGYHLMAPLLAQTQDQPGYEALCARISKQFAGATDPYTADRMAKDCLILPRPGADLKVPGELAQTAVTKGGKDTGALHYFQCCKALAEYRLGNWEVAIDWANRAAAKSFPYSRAEANAILAMAQFQLKHVEEARHALNKCTEVVSTELPKFTDKDLGGDWRDLIIAHALQSEAKRMIEGEPSPAAPPAKLAP